jgi:23S rRNA-/tRNA-specific pseudouridylate synthase
MASLCVVYVCIRRLDMNTSGVLLAAKDKATASAAHAQFRAKTVSKAYLALALGVPSISNFSVDGAIGQHPSVKVARQVAAGGQHALTHMEVKWQFEWTTQAHVVCMLRDGVDAMIKSVTCCVCCSCSQGVFSKATEKARQVYASQLHVRCC